jgi:hypothetical protein
MNAAAKNKPASTKKAPALTLVTLPKVGDRRPGGVVAAVMPAYGKRPAYVLILADEEHGVAESLAWGGYGTEIKGLSDWDGLANTKKLVKARTAHPAAEFCAGLVIDGCNDFYLPARDEARLIFASSRGLIKSTRWHWTSSQYSSYNAFSQYFVGGSQGNGGKSHEARVRAVRRELIN